MAFKAPKINKRELWFYLKRALWIFIAWSAVSNLLFFYDYFLLVNNNALTSAYDFKQSYTTNLIIHVSAGVIGGLITVNLMEHWLHKYVFYRALIQITIVYTIAAFLVGSLGAVYFFSEEFGVGLFDTKVLSQLLMFFKSWLFIKNFFTWLVIVLVTLIILLINKKYGPGVFPDYLMGRYFMPKNERRIFMFADIKNATGIAETLGEEQYFNFLKDFFKDISPAILNNKGEVYQYVGDEIVISWKLKNGIKGGNAVQCYFDMVDRIDMRKQTYTKKYHCIPEFKVGYHFGNVMVGEVGQIKREIVFSGDVLNTASRIQSLCNDMGVTILASEAFADIQTKIASSITRINLGEEKLRGKTEEMKLVTYSRNLKNNL